ncbi:DUF4386 domain-containing protein [Litoribaculum gwangyangense]|uniref:DUF4386 domain-containing protein n=1 Tax=Litoribaculum gwangyangense TaxID=1130722 RepID=A0ABP9CBK2_9FLAO
MRTYARISGIAYLLIFIFGFYANFAILETLVDINNSAETTLNIFDNSIQFRNGLFGFCVMLISDIFLIWSLFKFTKSTHKTISYLASLFRGFHAVFFAIAMVKLIQVYQVTMATTYALELQSTVINLLVEFNKQWTIGLLFFGVHLLLLGFLAFKSHVIPTWMSFLLILAAVGYFVDGFAKLYVANYSDFQSYYEAIVILTGVAGELSFTIWLLIKGFSKRAFVV